MMMMMMMSINQFLSLKMMNSLLNQSIILILSIYLIIEIKSKYKEYQNQKKAKSLNSKLAPLVTSSLPFGLSFLKHRLHSIKNGNPSDSLDHHHSFTKTQPIKVIRFKLFSSLEFIQTYSHLDVKYILSNNFQNWGKSNHFMEAFNPLLGEGVFSSDQRSLWSWHRSLSKPHFSKQRVSDVNACEEHVARLITWIELQNMSDHPVDVQDLFSRLTLTIGSQHLFGHCLDMLNDLLLDRPIHEGTIDAAAFSKDFADAQTHCLKHVFMPSFIRRLIQRFTPPNQSIQRVLKAVDILIENSAKANPNGKDIQEPENLLDHLRQSDCSHDLLRHELLNLLLAARDTTSSLLTSCLYELSAHPSLWNQLRIESSQLSQSHLISIDQLRELKLLRAVINETLRLHPPVWANTRHAFEDDVLPSGIFVPAGTDCRYLIREFQRDPEVWGKDAEEFVPERWLDGRQVLQSKDPFSFQPFSAGPRICLGQQFAYTEVSITLIRLINKFSRVELVGKSSNRADFQEMPLVTLSVRGGLWVKFHP
ncbi:uncharacterized protein MELLADRAFT_117454 [Melampsora larici-populina 98AG31]|uniref:Related cytochrome p450 monooxygenase n=1 Tax=Melampsora larici-populina (strain 98AG31 / pathotype 3-4-7) TaxID=747676 RepID=F4RXB8_MELLP|nr:uncharacterized protein MELLADRAFT_117454 [Melampsora larici-populina 98AG31]EGG03014.1 related cytochrome p450 monooxygenase [Melampsora larici-populina 98AG31]